MHFVSLGKKCVMLVYCLLGKMQLELYKLGDPFFLLVTTQQTTEIPISLLILTAPKSWCNCWDHISIIKVGREKNSSQGRRKKRSRYSVWNVIIGRVAASRLMLLVGKKSWNFWHQNCKNSLMHLHYLAPCWCLWNIGNCWWYNNT